MKLLNESETKELFGREAILIGSSDGVPLFRAVELFGGRAAEFASAEPGKGFNVYGTGKFQLPYLDYCGFRRAASYANVQEIGRRQKDNRRNGECLR
ncbi:hypothetical protein AAK912_04215 [Merdimmobilis hominis]|uniref:hypothetical protein n=1 Tax=Merdimmobilis hominis TaxID=2897707 RepID=UPI003513D7E4